MSSFSGAQEEHHPHLHPGKDRHASCSGFPDGTSSSRMTSIDLADEAREERGSVLEQVRKDDLDVLEHNDVFVHDDDLVVFEHTV